MSLSEILFLGILGLVVFGPKKLVELEWDCELRGITCYGDIITVTVHECH